MMNLRLFVGIITCTFIFMSTQASASCGAGTRSALAATSLNKMQHGLHHHGKPIQAPLIKN